MIFFQNQLLLKARPVPVEPAKVNKNYDTKIFGLFYEFLISLLFAIVFIVMKDIKTRHIISYKVQVSTTLKIMGFLAIIIKICSLISASSTTADSKTQEDKTGKSGDKSGKNDEISDELMMAIFIFTSAFFFVGG